MTYLQSIMGDSEHTVFTTRHHWVVVIGAILSGLFFIALILAVAGILASATGQPAMLLILLLLILPVGRLADKYLDWWNEQFVVTNRRIIQIGGLFNKHVIDSSLEKVNDVVMDQSFAGRMFNYGDIEIMTASEIGVNRLEKISRPIAFKTAMLNAKEEMVGDSDMHHITTRAADEPTITALLTELANLRDKGLITEDEFEAKKKDLMARL